MPRGSRNSDLTLVKAWQEAQSHSRCAPLWDASQDEGDSCSCGTL